MSSALARLATNDTNDAANAVSTQLNDADNSFDPSSGARGVPGRGMVSMALCVSFVVWDSVIVRLANTIVRARRPPMSGAVSRLTVQHSLLEL